MSWLYKQYLEFLNDSSILIHVTNDYHGPYNYHHKIQCHEKNATQNQKNTYQFRSQNTAVYAHRWLGVVWPPAPATLSQGSCHPMTVSAPYSNHWCKWLLWCRPIAVKVWWREVCVCVWGGEWKRERKGQRERGGGRVCVREKVRARVYLGTTAIWLTCVPSATSGTSGR